MAIDLKPAGINQREDRGGVEFWKLFQEEGTSWANYLMEFIEIQKPKEGSVVGLQKTSNSIIQAKTCQNYIDYFLLKESFLNFLDMKPRKEISNI